MLLFPSDSHTHDPAVVLVRLSDLMAEMSSKALTPGIILCLSDDKCLLKDILKCRLSTAPGGEAFL